MRSSRVEWNGVEFSIRGKLYNSYLMQSAKAIIFEAWSRVLLRFGNTACCFRESRAPFSVLLSHSKMIGFANVIIAWPGELWKNGQSRSPRKRKKLVIDSFAIRCDVTRVLYEIQLSRTSRLHLTTESHAVGSLVINMYETRYTRWEINVNAIGDRYETIQLSVQSFDWK